MGTSVDEACASCVLTSRDVRRLDLDGEGRCHYCREYRRRQRAFTQSGAAARATLEAKRARIRADGAGRAYDCVAGISGGVDSSYVLYLLKEWGLRPLVVHLDNGWNAELAAANIGTLVTKLGFDLSTRVVRWEEFRDLQLAYLKASVIDVEVPTDHAILATLHDAARAQGIRHVVLGTNVATEGLLPQEWVWSKMDALNLRAIHRRHGKVALRDFPVLDFWKATYDFAVRKVEYFEPLNLVPYDKDEAKRTLIDRFGWRDYGGKHHESIFTRFYQARILPAKFGVDKRKAHYASLILAGKMARADALRALAEPHYDPALIAQDEAFVLKKLGLSAAEFAEILRAPPRPHDAYPTYFTRHYARHAALVRLLSPLLALRRRILGKRPGEAY